MSTYEERVAELEAQIRAIRNEQKAELAERQKSVTPVWRFTILPNEDRSFDKIWDKSVVLYQLRGEVVNRDECEAVGHDVRQMSGSMNYLFNTLSGRLVMSTGGGNVYLSDKTWSLRSDKEAVQRSFEKAVTAIESFLAEHPEGGDITEIISQHRAETRGQ